MTRPFRFETTPLSGEFAAEAATHEFGSAESDMEQESEFGSRRPQPMQTAWQRPAQKQSAFRFHPPQQFGRERWQRRMGFPAYGVYAPWGGQAVEEPPDARTDPQATSEYVRWVQSRLNAALGLTLPTTGIMDSATRSAVRSFQKRQGLPVDGIVGPPTEQALAAAIRPSTPVNAFPRGRRKQRD